MKYNKKPGTKNQTRWIIVGAALLAMSIPGAAYSKFYIGYGIANVDIGGDMDGVTFVGGGGSVEVLPDQDTGSGTKLIIGTQSNKGAFELSTTQSDHDGSWGGLPFSSEFFSLNFDGKILFNKGMFRPFGLFGFGFSSVTVKGGSTDGFNVDNAKFKGMDLRFGGGIEIAVMKNVAIDLQIVQRWGSYNSVDGITSGSVEDADINGDGKTMSLEVKYIFD